MKLGEVRCIDCGGDEIIAVWPGKEDVQLEMFRLVPGRPVRGWCEACWLQRYGPKPRLPKRRNMPTSVNRDI